MLISDFYMFVTAITKLKKIWAPASLSLMLFNKTTFYSIPDGENENNSTKPVKLRSQNNSHDPNSEKQ